MHRRNPSPESTAKLIKHRSNTRVSTVVAGPVRRAPESLQLGVALDEVVEERAQNVGLHHHQAQHAHRAHHQLVPPARQPRRAVTAVRHDGATHISQCRNLAQPSPLVGPLRIHALGRIVSFQLGLHMHNIRQLDAELGRLTRHGMQSAASSGSRASCGPGELLFWHVTNVMYNVMNRAQCIALTRMGSYQRRLQACRVRKMHARGG